MTEPQVDLAGYAENGFCYLPGLFSAEELRPLSDFLAGGRADPDSFAIPDNQGGKAELLVWTHCGDDFIGSVPRLRRMVDVAEAVIGEAVYHWHSKITFKPPGRPGSWEWHQDFGHWYMEGCLWPKMTSVAVALDPMAADNGPLRLVRGSHHLGRIDHVPLGPSNGADPAYVERALEQLDTVEIHLEPGDGIAFHCNVLHASGPNQSARPRSLFMSSYNAVSNPPANPKVPGHEYSALHVLDDGALAPDVPVISDSALRRPDGDSVYGYKLTGEEGAAPANA